MVNFSSVDAALIDAFIKVTENAKKTENYPGTWSVVGFEDGLTVSVDRLATANWIKSTGNLRNFPGKVQFIIENAGQRA